MNIPNTSKSILKHIEGELSSIYSLNEAKSIAFLLLEHFFEVSRQDVLLNKALGLSFEDVINKLKGIIERLKNHEPIQYIIGETDFYGCKIKVNPSVLIPRPETEELVDLIIKDHKSKEALTVVDICTGSGCIAIALARNLIASQLYGLDLSQEALNIAEQNSKVNAAKVEFSKVDILVDEIPGDILFDIIVSNPPYIENTEKALMQRNVLDHEPHLALFVESSDPLIFYKIIVEQGLKRLKEQGYLYFEINERFGKEIQEIMSQLKFVDVSIIKDINGKDRIVKGRKADKSI